MRFYVLIWVLLVLAFAAVARVAPSNKFEEGLLKVIERCIEGDVQLLPVGFPSLKPLKIPSMKINYNGYTMSFNEIKIKGLEDLTLQKLSASPSDLTVSLEFFIPTLAVRADRYHLQAKAMLFFNIDDKGTLKSNIDNLKVRAEIQFGTKGKDMIITDLSLDYSVDDIQVHLSGSNSLVNSRINDQISDLINDSEMTERLQNIIIDTAREHLRGHTPQEFVDIISAIR